MISHEYFLHFFRSKLSPERVFSWNLIPRIAYKRSGFGPGLLVSRSENGRALVSTVASTNSVVQGVITSVLNGSIFIEFRSTHQNSFYFVKDNPHKLRDDTEELKRLGGLFNISVHDAENGIKVITSVSLSLKSFIGFTFFITFSYEIFTGAKTVEWGNEYFRAVRNRRGRRTWASS